MTKILLTGVTFSVLMATSALAADIRIATEGAYAPYNFKDSAGRLVGFEIDLAAELCRRMEMECELVEQAWDGIIPSLVAGKYDAIMAGMSIKPEREEVISFSRHYANTPIRFGTSGGSPLADYQASIATLTLDAINAAEEAELAALTEAMADMTVGVQISTTHEAFMQEFMPSINLKSYDTMDNMILDLEAGRIDAGYTAVTSLRPLIAAGSDVQLVGPAMTGGPLGAGVAVGVRQEDNELRAAFSAAIDTMIADGSLSEMAVKWFGFDASAPE
jgi:octopine/nopaline transport system substrate-binding protein